MLDILDYSEGIHEGYKNDGRANGSFYPQGNVCRFCERKLITVFSKGITEYDPENKDSRQDIHHYVTAQPCNCGWWTVKDIQTPDAHNSYAPAEWVFSYRGALRTFSPADVTVPMDSLRRAIATHPDVINSIDPYKMEDLVGAVMTDFWPGAKCKHCGRSNDGGIDLILVNGDKPFAIQVKRRSRSNKGESVHHVTHFIGALMLAGIPDGIFVTTADHFTGAAEKAAASVLESGLVDTFQLIDRKPFLEMLEATTKNLSNPWLSCIPKVLRLDESDSGLTPYSVCLRPPSADSTS